MPAPYITPSYNDTDNLYHLFGYITNTATDGLFMPLMLGVVWFIAMIGTLSEGRGASRGFIFASFITSILAIILALINLINAQYMYFLFLLVGAGLIWKYLADSPGI